MNTRLNSIKNKLLVSNKAFLLVIILFVVMSFASDVFLSSDNLFNLFRQTSVSCIIAMGFTFIIGLAEIDLSVGAIAGFTGVLMALMMRDANVPVALAILIGFGIGIGCECINALIISGLKLPAFVVTLATQSIFRGGCYILTDMRPINPLPAEFNIIGAGYIGPIPIPIFILVAMVIITFILADRTKLGRYVVAAGNNLNASIANGINIFKTRLKVYAFMGVCAALCAVILTGRTASAQPTAGLNMELDAIAAVVMGGASLFGGKLNVIGALFGAFIIGIITNGMNLLSVDTNYQIIVKGLLILAALIMDAVSMTYVEKLKKKQLLEKE